MLEYLPPIAKEVDAEFALVEVALNAKPAMDMAVPLAKRGAAALVTDLLAWLLPVAPLIAGVRRVVLFVDFDIGGGFFPAISPPPDDRTLFSPPPRRARPSAHTPPT